MATFEQVSFLNDIFEDFKIYEKKLLKNILDNINDSSQAFQENLDLVTETIHLLIKSFELQLNENRLLPEQRALLENSAVLLIKGAHI